MYTPTRSASAAALALLQWVQEQEDPMYFLSRLFKPLWGDYSPLINETGTMMAFVGNPANALLFWEWVYDHHKTSFLCVIRLFDLEIQRMGR